MLSQDKEIESILSQVQASARNAGLKIQQGVSKPVVPKEAYSEWPIEMQVLGDYHSLGVRFCRRFGSFRESSTSGNSASTAVQAQRRISAV